MIHIHLTLEKIIIVYKIINNEQKSMMIGNLPAAVMRRVVTYVGNCYKSVAPLSKDHLSLYRETEVIPPLEKKTSVYQYGTLDDIRRTEDGIYFNVMLLPCQDFEEVDLHPEENRVYSLMENLLMADRKDILEVIVRNEENYCLTSELIFVACECQKWDMIDFIIKNSPQEKKEWVIENWNHEITRNENPNVNLMLISHGFELY